MLRAASAGRRLVERTGEMAQKKGGSSSRSLRAALDSSPLWGAARVEDTYNLLGHLLRKAIGVIARQQQQDLEIVASEAGVAIVDNSSLKAALDLDWDDPVAKAQALTTILQALAQVESWVQQQPNLNEKTMTQVKKSLADGRQVEAQDVEVADDRSPKLRKGVAKNRPISIEDEEMRHGRKSRSQRFARKNLFDLRPMAVVDNLHVIARMLMLTLEEAA